ncbi:Uncharacterised protein [Vibrio cholerae]|nr:Uncharacterised protein [Vibrio cholerae]
MCLYQMAAKFHYRQVMIFTVQFGDNLKISR